MSTSLLSIEDLSVEVASRHGRFPVLRGVSISVPSGSTLGLVGESGSGKSVTCRSVLRLLPSSMTVSGGSICFRDLDLSSLSHREFEALRGDRIAFVPQDPLTSLNPVMRVGDQVAEALRVHRNGPRATTEARAEELLKRVGIPAARERMRAYPHELSGG
ncbi:MAG: ATP-binding cassette domain-containing protein, partial [Actinobacteria bacterium]|nr:ATP-binding cassette domain-containing protein [Actinomycetota bacterium]